MRYVKALGVGLAIVVFGIWTGNRLARKRGGYSIPGTAYSVKIPGKAPDPMLQAGAAAMAEIVTSPQPAADRGPASSAAKVPALSALKLIRSGELSIELDSYEDGARAADAIARSLEGYVAESKSSGAEGAPAGGTLSIRVPAARFDEAFRRLSGLGKVRTLQLHTQDVTKEYFDLETRLRVERDAETRLREVLRNRTARLSDIVEAERELTRVVEEIEQTEGARLFYDRQVAFSTIALELAEPAVAPAPVAEPSALQPIRNALHQSQFLLASSAAGLIYALAAGLPWVAVAALLWAIVRRMRARRALRLAA